MMSNLSRSGRQRFREKHVSGWRATGLSQVEYCRVNKISLKSFQYWRRKSKGSDTPPVLVELPLPKTLSVPLSPSCPQLCLVVDRYRIEIGKGFDSDDLERVVRMLGRL